MINFKVEKQGIFIQSNFIDWTGDTKDKLWDAVKKGLEVGSKKIREEVQKNVTANLKIKRQAVLKSFKVKIFANSKKNFPTMIAYSGVPWMGVHTKGVQIGGGLLLPLTTKRIGYKTWMTLLRDLKAANNLFIDKSSKPVLYWAMNTPAFKSQLAPFRKLETKKRKEQKANGQNVKTSIKSGERVNIAVYVKSTRVKKRIDFERIINSNLSFVVQKIEENMKV